MRGQIIYGHEIKASLTNGQKVMEKGGFIDTVGV